MVQKFLQLSLIATMFSFFIGIEFTTMSFGENTESLKEQLKKGVNYKDVTCKEYHILVILQWGKIACLSQTTFLKLEEREYIKSVIQKFIQEPESQKDIPLPNVRSGVTVKGDTGLATISTITNVPASIGSIVNFYVTDADLNTSSTRVDIIDTTNLLQFSINGIAIEGPKTMTETGFDSGQFYVKLQLPDLINGVPISQDDVVEIKYLDESDAGGEQHISTKSIALSQTYAQVQISGNGKTRIGHEFTVRIYESDANLDSRDVDRIPLSRIEYRGEGGIRTTLANPGFDANASSLRETGENTGIFEIIIKIPRTIDGKIVHIGDWYELRYVDLSTPSKSFEEIKLRGKIGN